jgi:Mycobacterium membrane protein
MSGPNPPGPESFGDEPSGEPIADEHTEDVSTDTGFSQAYSAPESEQFTSGPYVPADLALYDYDTYDPVSEYDDQPPTAPRWPWIVGVAAILAAVALVASVSLLVFPSLTRNEAAPTTTTQPPPPVQDEITKTTPPPPPPTSEVPPPPPTETVTVTSEPAPPPPPPSTEAPPPPPAPSSAPPPPATTSAAPPPATTTKSGPRQVTYTVTGTKAPGDIITITFTDASGRSRTQRNVYIPWSFTLTPISNSEIGSVEASSLFRVSQLNCSITASDGTVLSQRSDNAPVTSC